MDHIGRSSLWVEKYRPKTFNDIIAPPEFHKFLSTIKVEGTTPNLILNGPAGTGKTAIARAIVRELHASELYINSSEKTGIDDVRFEVRGFATTMSLESLEGGKIAILDEFDRLSGFAMDALKSLVEETSDSCRFIFITNNIRKVITPLLSRCQQFTFGINKKDVQGLASQYLKRCEFILKNEGVEYDKNSVGKFIVKKFPDLRKIINELQKCYQTFGLIDKRIEDLLDVEIIRELVTDMKDMKFKSVRKTCSSTLDPNTFYTAFYADIDEFVKPESLPDIVMILAEFAFKDGHSIDREINLFACLVELMRNTKWK